MFQDSESEMYLLLSVEEHYGWNRHNRRTVREDIPVAKVVQSQEEVEQQKERLRKLAALQAQSVLHWFTLLFSSIQFNSIHLYYLQGEIH